MNEATEHKVWIVWGGAPEPGATPSEYSFATEAEAEAFLLGVQEMDGWMGYEQVDGPNYIVNDDYEVVQIDG